MTKNELWLRVPNTPEEWKRYEAEIRQRWKFPHCLGAVGGKHIGLIHPVNSGSEFYNYKGFFLLC